MDIKNKINKEDKKKAREITFIVPLHRMHLKKFDSTFQSLLDSKINNISFKTIVVLNGSVKKEEESFFLKEPEKFNITLLKYDEEKTCSLARNIGYQQASTEIVVFLDGDVILPKNFFTNLDVYFTEMDNDPTIGGLCPVFALNTNIESKWQKYENLEDMRSLNSYRSGKYVRVLQGFCIIVKRSVFEEIGSFERTFMASEDRELAIRMVRAGYKIMFMPDIKILHLNPSKLRNILKRKRWHAIGNAQLALKYPEFYNKTLLKRIEIIIKRPFQVGLFDPFAYFYYWYVMSFYTAYFIYFKHKFKHGFTKTDRS